MAATKPERTMPSPAFLPVYRLSADIAAGRLSPVDLVDDCLTRTARLEPKLQAYVSVHAAEARMAAEAADKAIRSGHRIGPLHGIPIAVKDLVEIEGKVAMGGTAAWKDRVASQTATLYR
jgi:aspartyl-tRNA(Asn)/glutamyl-tRNA(Gln) amidotransferase subunit A